MKTLRFRESNKFIQGHTIHVMAVDTVLPTTCPLYMVTCCSRLDESRTHVTTPVWLQLWYHFLIAFPLTCVSAFPLPNLDSYIDRIERSFFALTNQATWSRREMTVQKVQFYDFPGWFDQHLWASFLSFAKWEKYDSYRIGCASHFICI